MVYKILGDDFSGWMDEKIQERNQKIMVERQMMINVDPEIAAAFQSTNHVSSR